MDERGVQHWGLWWSWPRAPGSARPTGAALERAEKFLKAIHAKNPLRFQRVSDLDECFYECVRQCAARQLCILQITLCNEAGGLWESARGARS